MPEQTPGAAGAAHVTAMQRTIALWYDRLVLRRPWTVLLVLALAGAAAISQAGGFRLDASADSLLLETDRDLRTFREVAGRYAEGEFLVVTFTPHGDLFDTAALDAVERLSRALGELERVSEVLSILDVPLIRNVPDGKLSDLIENVRTLRSESLDLARAREELVSSPIFRELLISADGRTTALRVTLRSDPDFVALREARDELLRRQHASGLDAAGRDKLAQVRAQYDALKTRLDRERHADIVRVREILADFAASGELHLGGIPMIADDMITFIANDLAVFGGGVLVFLVAMLWLIFRRARWIALPLASCLFAGLVMVGLLGFAGWRVTVISSNFISLMLIITMSMNIHLIVRYRQLARDDAQATQHDLVRRTAERMVWPCLYTALTTIIAFLSLVVSDIKPVIDFGWMMTLALTVTFVTSFTLFPAVLVLLGRIETPPDAPSRWQFTALLSRFTERHGTLIVLLSAALVVVSAVGVSRLRVENSFIDYFKSDTEIYRGMKLIDDTLGGTTPLDVVIRFSGYGDVPAREAEPPAPPGLFKELEGLLGDDEPEDPAQHWFTPQKIELIKAVHDYLEGFPAVGKVLSLASLIRAAEQLNEGKPFTGIELALIYKRLPEEIRAQMITPFVSIADDETRLTLRVRDSAPGLRRQALLADIERGLTGELGLHPERVTVTGVLLLYNNMLQSLFSSQIETLGVVMAGVALMLLVLFRSLSLAVIGIVPNLLAAAVILGLMGLASIPLDMMTITIAAITIGIAVDNSIHYIYRFREEFPRSGDYVATLHYCHANIGRAVFYTAITIIVGFSILVLSNFIPTVYFGAFTALAMAIALLAALTLLPRLLMWWRPFRQPG